MEYLERKLFDELIKWMDRREIIAIKGPRQSGKTTLLRMLRERLILNGTNKDRIVSLSFEDRELMAKFIEDPRGLIRRYVDEQERSYFFIDEAHYCPDLGQKLKLAFDTFENVKFVITGSSSLELTSRTAGDLVGRLFSFELLPFDFEEYLSAKDNGLRREYSERSKQVREALMSGHDIEIPPQDMFSNELLRHLGDFLVFGGYPEVVKASSDEERRIIITNIYNTYIEKDILAYLQITDTQAFNRLVSLLAFMTGQMLSYENLAASSGSNYAHVRSMLDVLSQTYVVHILTPYHRNLATELRKSPKAYFYDTGLRSHGAKNFNGIDDREDIGHLAENHVHNALLRSFETFNYWRTAGKAEVDFVVPVGDTIVPIEVKFQNLKGPEMTRSLHSFIDAYKPKHAVVVTKDLWAKREVGETTVYFIPIVYF